MFDGIGTKCFTPLSANGLSRPKPSCFLSISVSVSFRKDGIEQVGEIGVELDIPSSTLSHHLEKLKHEDLAKVRREDTFLWYSANTEGLQELLGSLYAECCTRNKAIEPQTIVRLCN